MRNNQSDEDKLMREEMKKLYEEIQMIQQEKKALALEESKIAEMHLMEEVKYRKQREDEH